MRAAAADRTQTSSLTYLLCAVAWFVPGAGHLWLGRRQKGIVFLDALTLMFVFGATDSFANIHGPNERLLVDEWEKAVLAETLFFQELADRMRRTR